MTHKYGLFAAMGVCGAVAVGSSLINSSTATADSMDFVVDQNFTNSTDASVKIVLDDAVSPGSIKITVSVLEPLADLRGIFFHVADEALIDGLSVTGADVTDFLLESNQVDNLGGGANINGGGAANLGPYDVGIEIGTQGIGRDDLSMTMFTLSHDTMALDLSLLAEQAFGVRLTSVGEIGNRGGSSKLQGFSPSLIPVPEPTSALILTALGLASIRTRKQSG